MSESAHATSTTSAKKDSTKKDAAARSEEVSTGEDAPLLSMLRERDTETRAGLGSAPRRRSGLRQLGGRSRGAARRGHGGPARRSRSSASTTAPRASRSFSPNRFRPLPQTAVKGAREQGQEGRRLEGRGLPGPRRRGTGTTSRATESTS